MNALPRGAKPMNCGKVCIFAAVVDAKAPRRQDSTQNEGYFSSFGTGTQSSASKLIAQQLGAETLLSDPVPLVTLDQRQAQKAMLDTRLELHITRAGDASGVALWVGDDPTDDGPVNAISSATAERVLTPSNTQVFFAWPEQVALAKGDYVRLIVRADGSTKECDWHWDSLIRKIESGSIQGICYQQHTASPLAALNSR